MFVGWGRVSQRILRFVNNNLTILNVNQAESVSPWMEIFEFCHWFLTESRVEDCCLKLDETAGLIFLVCIFSTS